MNFLYEKGKENSDYADHDYMEKSGIKTKEHYLRIATNPFTNFKDAEDLTGTPNVDKKEILLFQQTTKILFKGINNFASNEVGVSAKQIM